MSLICRARIPPRPAGTEVVLFIGGYARKKKLGLRSHRPASMQAHKTTTKETKTKAKQEDWEQSEWITLLHRLWLKENEESPPNLKPESDEDSAPELDWESQKEARKKRAEERAKHRS